MNAVYKHTNMASPDWRRLADFYIQVFGCLPKPPERDYSGEWLDKGVGLNGARLRGMHLLLPGHGENGPTLEIFQYDEMDQRPEVNANTPGFTHIAFEVDDVGAMAERMTEHGATPVGERITRDVPGIGQLNFQYLRDPDNNIVEILNWE